MIIFTRSPTAQNWGKSQLPHHQIQDKQDQQDQQTQQIHQKLEEGGYNNYENIFHVHLDDGNTQLNSLFGEELGGKGGKRGGEGGRGEEELEMRWEKYPPAVSDFSVIVPPEVIFSYFIYCFSDLFFFGLFFFFFHYQNYHTIL